MGRAQINVFLVVIRKHYRRMGVVSAILGCLRLGGVAWPVMEAA